MKVSGFLRKNVFWAVLLGGFIWLLQGGISLSASQAKSVMQLSVQSPKGMKSSCPMKGNLPCCQHKASVSLCRMPSCNLCFQSVPLKEGNVSSNFQVQPPVSKSFFYPETVDTFLQRSCQPLLSFSLSRVSFTPAVNQPLLI
jgi:hypothetical protein